MRCMCRMLPATCCAVLCCAERESLALHQRCLQASVTTSPTGLLNRAYSIAAHLNLELPQIAGEALLLREVQELGLPQVSRISDSCNAWQPPRPIQHQSQQLYSAASTDVTIRHVNAAAGQVPIHRSIACCRACWAAMSSQTTQRSKCTCPDRCMSCWVRHDKGRPQQSYSYGTDCSVDDH